MSQQDLSDAAGIGTAILSRYERGLAEPKPATLIKLGKALWTNPEWLTNNETVTEEYEVRVMIPSGIYERLSSEAADNGTTIDQVINARLLLSSHSEKIFDEHKKLQQEHRGMVSSIKDLLSQATSVSHDTLKLMKYIETLQPGLIDQAKEMMSKEGEQLD